MIHCEKTVYRDLCKGHQLFLKEETRGDTFESLASNSHTDVKSLIHGGRRPEGHLSWCAEGQ